MAKKEFLNDKRLLIQKTLIFIQACENLEKTNGRLLPINDLKKECMKLAKGMDIKLDSQDFRYIDNEIMMAGYTFHPRKNVVQRVSTFQQS